MSDTSDAREARPYINRAQASHAKRAIVDGETLRGLGEIFKALADETRLKICFALQRHELCVTDIAGIAGISESAASHQLRLLKTMRLVRHRRSELFSSRFNCLRVREHRLLRRSDYCLASPSETLRYYAMSNREFCRRRISPRC